MFTDEELDILIQLLDKTPVQGTMTTLGPLLHKMLEIRVKLTKMRLELKHPDMLLSQEKGE